MRAFVPPTDRQFSVGSHERPGEQQAGQHIQSRARCLYEEEEEEEEEKKKKLIMAISSDQLSQAERYIYVNGKT